MNNQQIIDQNQNLELTEEQLDQIAGGISFLDALELGAPTPRGSKRRVIQSPITVNGKPWKPLILS